MGDDFWDRRAAILKHHAAIHEARKAGRQVSYAPGRSENDLYLSALEAVGPVSFEQERIERKLRPQFLHLEERHALAAAAVGAFGAIVAVATELVGKRLEPEILPEFDRNSPTDYLKGSDHRYYFGHDVFNPAQKLPHGFKYLGEDVGGRTLWDMMQGAFADRSGLPAGIGLTIAHYVVHYLRDLITPAGLPLPGSSYFTRWESNVLNSSGFSRRNELMSRLGREFGSINAGDFTSVAAMKLLLRQYCDRQIPAGLSSRAAGIFRDQLDVIAYGSCLSVQLGLMVVTGVSDPTFRTKAAGAKLNLILGALFAKSTLSLLLAVDREHKEVVVAYESSIRVLEDRLMSIDHWVCR